MAEVQDYRKYLNPAIISKLNSLELKARLVVEGFMVGLHKSPYHGFSVEFTEHRPYMQGDNLKDVDWKVYGKTERYFIKQYEEETNLKSYILLDTSKSMDYSSGENITQVELFGYPGCCIKLFNDKAAGCCRTITLFGKNK